MKVKIIWFHYDGGGRVDNFSYENFSGSQAELDAIYDKQIKRNKKRRNEDGIRIVPNQVITNKP